MKNFAKLLSIIALTASLQITAMEIPEDSKSSLIEEQETLKKTIRAHPTCPLNYFKIATYVTGVCATIYALYDFHKNGFSNSNTVKFAKNLWTVQDPRKALFGYGTVALASFGWLWKQTNDQTNDLKKQNCFLREQIAEARNAKGLDFNPNDYVRNDKMDFFLDDCLKKRELRKKVEGYIREYKIYTKNNEGETQETDLFLQQEEDKELSEMGE